MSWSRAPAVAGRFYPADPARLGREVDHFLLDPGPPPGGPRPALMVMGPHAGYVYSGAIAGETYARVVVPERVVVMCPNHTGYGVRGSVWADGAWRMPGGDVPIDDELASAICEETDLQPDRRAHLAEHAAEVHLPFLVALRRNVRIVPICLGRLGLDECRATGSGIARAIRRDPQPTLIVASSDMSHYISAADAKRWDSMALDRISRLDAGGLHETVEAHDISMCGYIPTTVGILAALDLGAIRADLVRYGNSGDVSGDYASVVGYAGVTIR